ncbi:HTH-type transcriptional regulatory protein GabR [compost metagenome]
MWITIDKHSGLSLSRQIYGAIRSRILRGEPAAGDKLPSTRELSSQLGVSRNTVLEAYELLLAEGFLASRSGSGTYVAQGAVMKDAPLDPFSGHRHRQSSPVPVTASPDAGRREGRAVISFRTGLPEIGHFPRRTWGDLLRTAALDLPDLAFGYGDPAGEPQLRDALSRYLLQSRGVCVPAGGLAITSGAVQGIQLAARLLLQPGDEALIEEPTNAELKSILASTGAVLLGVPVDDYGLVTEALPRPGRSSLIYVTPSHQFPLGGILPIQRRIELIRYARETGSFIIEDDYDSEFRFDGAPVHSLQSLAPERVFYIGTFSKIMFPALRVGYAVIPPAFFERFVALKKLADYHTPVLEQIALARFIEERKLHTHIFRMRKIYRDRRNALLESLETHFPDRHRILGKAAGLHLTVELRTPLPDALPQLLGQEGVFASQIPGQRLVLGYGHLEKDEIAEGIRRIHSAIAKGEPQ